MNNSFLPTSAWVGCSSPSVCPEHNSEKKDPKVFKPGIRNELDILQVVWFLVLKGQRLRPRLGLTPIWHVFELYEFLLVIIIINIKLLLLLLSVI